MTFPSLSLITISSCPGGEIGRRTGLKILGPNSRAGSSPARGTTFKNYLKPLQ